MSRHLISIGVALVDAGARPDVIGWLVGLLASVHRAYLPMPGIEVDERQRTILQFRIDSRGLVLIAVRPGVGGWLRLHPNGSRDRGALGDPASGEITPRLIEWLLDGHDIGLGRYSETLPGRPIETSRLA